MMEYYHGPHPYSSWDLTPRPWTTWPTDLTPTDHGPPDPPDPNPPDHGLPVPWSNPHLNHGPPWIPDWPPPEPPDPPDPDPNPPDHEPHVPLIGSGGPWFRWGLLGPNRQTMDHLTTLTLWTEWHTLLKILPSLVIRTWSVNLKELKILGDLMDSPTFRDSFASQHRIHYLCITLLNLFLLLISVRLVLINSTVTFLSEILR